MDYKNLYIIYFKSLSHGSFQYDFEIDKKFFENIEESEIKEGDLQVHIDMQKTTAGLTLEYNLGGTVSIQCDRCLDFFDIDVDLTGTLKVISEENVPDTDPESDIMYLSPDVEELDLSAFLYESILLSLPVQKLHPDNEKGKSTCNKEMLKILKKHSVDKSEVDSRWEELKKYNNLN